MIDIVANEAVGSPSSQQAKTDTNIYEPDMQDTPRRRKLKLTVIKSRQTIEKRLLNWRTL